MYKDEKCPLCGKPPKITVINGKKMANCLDPKCCLGKCEPVMFEHWETRIEPFPRFLTVSTKLESCPFCKKTGCRKIFIDSEIALQCNYCGAVGPGSSLDKDCCPEKSWNTRGGIRFVIDNQK